LFVGIASDGTEALMQVVRIGCSAYLEACGVRKFNVNNWSEVNVIVMTVYWSVIIADDAKSSQRDNCPRLASGRPGSHSYKYWQEYCDDVRYLTGTLRGTRNQVMAVVATRLRCCR
jgi:hypothetical protein